MKTTLVLGSFLAPAALPAPSGSGAGGEGGSGSRFSAILISGYVSMVDPLVTAQFIPQHQPAIEQARITPPRSRTNTLPRRRIDQLLAMASELPLTLVAAPPGSGKTTALVRVARHGGWSTAWCRMDSNDTPSSLIHHLAAALAMVTPSNPLLTIPDGPDSADLLAAFHLLLAHMAAALEDDTLLILDDYHHADQRPELRAVIEYLAAHLPPRLHLILATRYEPLLNSLATARARGEALFINQSDLAFNLEEATALFAQISLGAPSNLDSVLIEARGWPLVLRLLGEALGHHPKPNADLVNLTAPLDAFFQHEIVEPLPAQLRDLLRDTAVLRWLDSRVCAALLPPNAEPELAEELMRRVSFIEMMTDRRLVYQPLFAAYLVRAAAQATDLRAAHVRAARYFRLVADLPEALHHLFAAGDTDGAADLLEQTADTWRTDGNAPALLDWLARLPEPQRNRPGLLLLSAAAHRHLGHFDIALADYVAADSAALHCADDQRRALALRGQAEIYLDTVQPTPAAALLTKALKLLPRELIAERSAILHMQAENWANRGRADIALLLEQTANRLERKPANAIQVSADPNVPLPPRLLLRSGRLNEACAQLEHDLGLSTGIIHHSEPPLHREPQLLLAFIDTLLGNGARALAMARRGLLESQQAGSRLTEAIAHMRLGHAYQVVAPQDPIATAHYQQALELIQATGVARTRAEAYLGITLVHGHRGDLASAQDAARLGLALAESSGDEWMAALLWLALGSSAVTSANPQAANWLEQARLRFQRGGDTYGQAVVALWLALDHLHAGRTNAAAAELIGLLDAIEHSGYTGLLTSPTLFGPRDQATILPLLLLSRTAPLQGTHQANIAEHILRQAYPTIAADELVDTYHPGYTLRIQMLGGFRIWRGTTEIQAREWQREKSRQLLQLLINYRGQWIQREQICAWLWPESDSIAAERQFKVTLNALNVAIEPQRPPRTPPFFIRRQGLAYSFAPSYGCWIDVDEFDLRLSGVLQAEPELALRNSRTAIQLYRGDYLPELLYESWASEERERLLARYLSAATDLAARLVQQGVLTEAIECCEQILRRDRCYEEAYQVLMQAHARSGSRSQAIRTYTRCVQSLNDELGIEPLPETIQMYDRIRRNDSV